MYFDEYVQSWRQIGEQEFNKRYTHPVFVGLGVVGTLAEDGERGQAQTFLAALHDQDGSSASLMRRVWPLVKREYGPQGRAVVLGRDRDNDVVIPDYSISKRHCDVARCDDGLALQDLDSHNGTIVGKHPIPSHLPIALRDEDEIVLGRYMFEYLNAKTFIARVKCAALSDLRPAG